MCLLEESSKITITACSLVQDVELQVYRLMLSHHIVQTNLEVLKSIWKFNSKSAVEGGSGVPAPTLIAVCNTTLGLLCNRSRCG